MTRKLWSVVLPVVSTVVLILLLVPSSPQTPAEFEFSADAPVAASMATRLRFTKSPPLGPIVRIMGAVTISASGERPVGALSLSFVDRTGRSNTQGPLPLVEEICAGGIERFVFAAHDGTERLLLERDAEHAAIGRVALERGGVLTPWESVALSPRPREPAWLANAGRLLGDMLRRALVTKTKPQ